MAGRRPRLGIRDYLWGLLGVVLVWLAVIVLDELGLFDTSGRLARFIVIGATVFVLEGVLEHRRRLAGSRGGDGR